jgi:hypothetical protein
VIAFIIAGLTLVVVLAVAFLATYGSPKRWSDTGMGWHIAAFTTAVTVLVTLLLLAMLGVRIPGWLGAVAVYGLAAAMAWRLVLAVQARRTARRRKET